LRHCEREAGRLGADRLMLTVNKRNSKAIAAYQRNGFAIMDSVVVDIGGGFVMDDYVMEKEMLPPHPGA
jgi:ribosomal protein S18 acetylase RimI-like enzyme